MAGQRGDKSERDWQVRDNDMCHTHLTSAARRWQLRTDFHSCGKVQGRINDKLRGQQFV